MSDEASPIPDPYPFRGTPAFPTKIGTQPIGMPLHACMGLNSCKGSDRFGLEGHPDGKGGFKVNDCAGQGYCATAYDHTCHVQNSCKGQGGCGLYGTGKEMSEPGQNECRSLGSCATPINAERFITNRHKTFDDTDIQGTSVWARAREMFEKKWIETHKQLNKKQNNGEISSDLNIPETLGQPPAPFTNIGPSYLWMSENNKERGNMTACGASGMSGAGGCS